MPGVIAAHCEGPATEMHEDRVAGAGGELRDIVGDDHRSQLSLGVGIGSELAVAAPIPHSE